LVFTAGNSVILGSSGLAASITLTDRVEDQASPESLPVFRAVYGDMVNLLLFAVPTASISSGLPRADDERLFGSGIHFVWDHSAILDAGCTATRSG
jgi:hypothetical protein